MADTKVGGVYIEIQAKMGSLERDLKSIEARLQKTDEVGQQTSSTFSQFGKYLSGGIIAAGLINVGKSALSAAANMEQSRVAFTTMLGSAEKSNKLLQQIQAFAESTPFQFNELVDASKRMIAFGYGAEEVVDKLGMIGNVAAGLGQPVGDLIYLLGTVKTAGRAMSVDIMQFANRGIPIYEELAKVMNVSKDQVKKLASEGKVTYAVVEKAFKGMSGEGGKFANLMSNQSNTLAGKWSNLNDQLDKTAVLLGQSMAKSAKDVVGIMANLLGIANGLVAKYNEMNSSQKHHVGALESINNGLNDTGEKLLAISKYEKDNAKAAYIYAEYLAGHIKLSDAQVEKLQEVLKLNRTIAEITKDTTSETQKQAEFIGGQAGYLLKIAEALQKVKKDTKGAGAPDPEAVKKWQAIKKAAEDLAKTINSSYLNALGSVDEKIDQQQADLQTQYDKMASDYKKNAITYEQYEKAKDQLNKQYRALEKSRFDKNLEDMAAKYGQWTGGLTQLSGQLSQVISMSASNQTTAIDNRLTKQIEAIDTAYNAEVEAINNSALSEEEKAAKLKALDEQKARDTEAAQKKADKEKRRINREAAKKQKAISIFETVLATPQAAFQAYKAMAGIPIVGPALGAIAAAAATALGIAKLKLIKDTPLPEAAYGGIVPAVPGGTPVRVAEKGSAEALIPLNDQGIGILKQALQGDNKGVSSLNVYLDGAVFGKWLFNSTKSGTVQFHANGLVA